MFCPSVSVESQRAVNSREDQTSGEYAIPMLVRFGFCVGLGVQATPTRSSGPTPKKVGGCPPSMSPTICVHSQSPPASNLPPWRPPP